MKDLKNLTTYTNNESIINYFSEDSIKKINKYFKRNKLVDLVTKYELYYHISLSSYVFETFLDLEETTIKLQELNLQVSTQKALFNIYNIIQKNFTNENLDKDLELLLRKEAALDALDDFINNDKELIGITYYRKQKQKDISNDIFFNEHMKFNFESNYLKTYKHYDLVITDEFLQKVQNKILNTSNSI